MYVCMYVHMYVCVYVRVCICIYIYMVPTPPPKDLGIFMVLGSVLGFKGWGWGAS